MCYGQGIGMRSAEGRVILDFYWVLLIVRNLKRWCFPPRCLFSLYRLVKVGWSLLVSRAGKCLLFCVSRNICENIQLVPQELSSVAMPGFSDSLRPGIMKYHVHAPRSVRGLSFVGFMFKNVVAFNNWYHFLHHSPYWVLLMPTTRSACAKRISWKRLDTWFISNCPRYEDVHWHFEMHRNGTCGEICLYWKVRYPSQILPLYLLQ